MGKRAEVEVQYDTSAGTTRGMLIGMAIVGACLIIDKLQAQNREINSLKYTVDSHAKMIQGIAKKVEYDPYEGMRITPEPMPVRIVSE